MCPGAGRKPRIGLKAFATTHIVAPYSSHDLEVVCPARVALGSRLLPSYLEKKHCHLTRAIHATADTTGRNRL